MKNISLILFSLLAFAGCTNNAKNGDDPWKDLFNGKDLTGFSQAGGQATYEVLDSVIVGTTVWGSPNSFLKTDSTYGDFILELDFKVADGLNSGIQFRSDVKPSGRVYGYQYEIDPTSRAYTAGIYDEARRGWLYPLNQDESAEARQAFKSDEWNHARIEAIGNTMKTWINGVPAANLVDSISPEGFIALQVHSINDSSMIGKRVEWKNIRILTENPEAQSQENNAPQKSNLINQLTEKEKEQGWKLLFNGKNTNGWRRAYHDSFPEKGWRVENGELIVQAANGAESQNGGDIVTVDQYSDFDLRLEFKYTKGANSGVKYFVTEKEENNNFSAIGLEFQILDDENHPDAKLGNHEGSRTLGSLYDLIKADKKNVPPTGEWNDLRIVSKGNHVEHWLNGFKVLEYERGSDQFRKLVKESKYKVYPSFGEAESGHILLQDHGFEVHFRSIKIKTL